MFKKKNKNQQSKEEVVETLMPPTSPEATAKTESKTRATEPTPSTTRATHFTETMSEKAEPEEFEVRYDDISAKIPGYIKPDYEITEEKLQVWCPFN